MIGGEFDITGRNDLKIYPENRILGKAITCSSGRSALFSVLKIIAEKQHITQVLVPDYLCSSILVPIVKLGLIPVFYRITDSFEIDKSSFRNLYKAGSVVLLINYFGLMDLTEQVVFIRGLEETSIIIEDDVQAFYEFKKDLVNVDYKFTSLRKTFALPDGGLIKAKGQLSTNFAHSNSFYQYKVAGSILKSYRDNALFSDEVYLELLAKGEQLIDADMEKDISDVSRSLSSFIDLEDISKKRIQNAQYLIQGLENLGISPMLPLRQGKTPLFVPIWLEQRNRVRHAMFQQEVFCPVHWPMDNMKVKKGADLSEHELSLIVDQRYSIKDMDLILNLISDNI